jgi:aminopeptidase N
MILSIAFMALAENPPPIPSLEQRNQLIAAEREATTGGPTPAAADWSFLPRAVHDEYDVTHYDVALSLDIPAHILTTTVTLQATASVSQLTQVAIDLYACMTVDRVLVNGVTASYTHPGSVLTVTLDHAYQPGQPFTISCTHHGTPSFPGQPLPFRWNFQSGIPMVLTYSEPYGAPAWWLCKDDPKDKATFGIHITCPDTLFAVSNGVLDHVTDNGNGTATYHWTHGYPLSPYLFSIAVTKYAHWTEPYVGLDGTSTMDVHYWSYPSDSARAVVDWSRNIEMMEFYAGLFGEYPFMTEKYAIAEFNHSGAMEHQTATSMGSQWITGDNQNDYVVVHELAHSWVGDMITMRTWAHAWCKEGFATLCEALYFEDRYGEAYYHDYLEAMNPLAYGQYQLYNISPPLHGAIYYKGAWVLHMLRHIVGDAAFFEAVHAYTNVPGFRYNVADTEDLRGVFEDVSGLDLAWFFDEWIYHPGYPSYQYGWTAQERGVDASPIGGDRSYDVDLSISQIQEVGPIFKMPIDVVIETDLGPESFVVWDSLATQSFTLHVAGRPQAVDLDPEMWILREVENPSGIGNDDAGSRRTAFFLAPAQPNPFRQATAIGFSLGDPGRVVMDICDVGGRRVTRLLDRMLPSGPGRIAWDGTDARGRFVAPGIYYCRIHAGEDERTQGILLVR